MNQFPPRARFVPPAGYITKEGAAELLNVSQSTIDRLLKSKALVPAPSIRRKPLVFEIEAVRKLSGGRTEPTTQAPAVLPLAAVKKARQS
jgi:hypothetical protein